MIEKNDCMHKIPAASLSLKVSFSLSLLIGHGLYTKLLCPIPCHLWSAARNKESYCIFPPTQVIHNEGALIQLRVIVNTMELELVMNDLSVSMGCAEPSSIVT